MDSTMIVLSVVMVIVIMAILILALYFLLKPKRKPSDQPVDPTFSNSLTSGGYLGELPDDSYLEAGKALYSDDLKTILTQQIDGNLVLYYSRTAIWTSGVPSNSTSHNVSVMQANGDLVMYPDLASAKLLKDALWSLNNVLTPTPSKSPIQIYTLEVQDGYFTISSDSGCYAYAPNGVSFPNQTLCKYHSTT